ncbi:FAD-dependent oxidoreductase [Neorhizobium sp. NCHU2750]|uniref:FAD-dependent oxidoreductase n=1 Tax=Neorhizobium sp. NCHU2750 TaxID=1825976 RepID=UPI000E73540A|nr:glycerol-3-phosphate dehydrogenase [Neorhizobium sp. NCHU2750]
MTAQPIIDGKKYDVIVIGGGAAGAASAQNLAAAGYETLLVDQGDFASGTSSRSSRLLYCGLAYFSPDYELWRFLYRPRDLFTRIRMARLSMRNRTHIASTMPERVNPYTFFFPVEKKGKYAGWKVALGYRALSLFGSRKAPLGYHHLETEKAASRHGLVRHMEKSKLSGLACFREYQYNWAERICIDTVMDAERCGATIANYTQVTAIDRAGDDWRITLAPAGHPGKAPKPASNATIQVSGKILVNTAGPWADRVLKKAIASPKKHLVGIKGVNVVVRLPDDCRGQGMETISSIDQPFYLMPWGDYHFFGPTETIYEGPPEDVRVLDEEIDFIIAEANRVFPKLNLTRKDVVYRWCGVRPRTSDTGKMGVKSFTMHDMAAEGMPNALTITGTPIMVHRHAGRKVAAEVARRISPSGRARPLSYAARLLPSGDGPKIGGVPVESLRFAAANEHVHTLLDLMFRRVNMGWQGDMGIPHARAVAQSVADILGWDEQRIDEEVDAYRAYVADHFDPRILKSPAADYAEQTA